MSTLGASGSIKTAAAAGNAEFPAPFLAHPFPPPANLACVLLLFLAKLKLFSQVLLHTFERKCLQSIRFVPQEFVSVLVRGRVLGVCGWGVCAYLYIGCPNGCCCSIYV